MASKSNEISRTQLTGSYLSVTISITLVIFMLGLIGLLVINAGRLSDYAKENIGISVFLNSDEKEMDVIRLQKELDASNYVIETIYVSKEEAARMLKEELGEDFENYLGYNPLPPSIDIKLSAKYANIDSIKVIESQLKKNPLVKEVFYQKSLVNLVNDNVKKIGAVLFLFSLLFLFISIALINNTIRLAYYSKRFTINTMQLVGATPAFIQKPFIVKSSFFGAFASLIAIFLMVVSIYFIQSSFEGIVIFKDKAIIFSLMFVLGVFISGFSTYFAVNKFLKLNTNQLYY
jgi:cell division transport system permease protein